MKSNDPSGQIQLVYIVGAGRTGSTLLGRLLGEYPDSVFLGETRYVWERGLVERWPCACGQPLPDCTFWSEVLASGLLPDQPEKWRQLANMRHATARMRHLLPSFLPGWRERLALEATPLVEAHINLYRAAQAIAGRPVIIDSSKDPSLLALLARRPELEVYALHLVRDPRGVVFSWSRKKRRPGPAGVSYMDQFGLVRSSVDWVGLNLGASLVGGTLGHRYKRIHYEALIREPEAVLLGLRRWLGLPDSTAESPIRGLVADLSLAHSVRGNPSAAEHGKVALKFDAEWETAMPWANQLATIVLAGWLAVMYGYPMAGRNARPDY